MRHQNQKNDRPDRVKSFAVTPLLSALKRAFSGVGLKAPVASRAAVKAPATVAPGIRFEALEPRVLLSGDVNPAALTINDQISVPGEQDHFAFTLDQPARVIFDSLTNRSDISWALDGPSGQVAHQTLSSSGSVNSESNPPIDLAAGNYALTVAGTEDATGSYALRMLDLSAATPIVPGVPMSGQLDPGAESDAYKFDAVEGERFAFELQSNNNDAGANWCLLDPSGNQIFQSGFVGSASEYPSALLYSGTYTLLIEGSITSNGPVDYNINVQPTPEVLFNTIASDAILSTETLDFRATFSEPLNEDYLDSSNVVLINTLTGAQVALDSFSYDNSTRQLRALFPELDEGTYQLSLINGGFCDLAGNALNGGTDFSVNFAVDAETRACPTPLVDERSAGFLVFDNTTTGAFHTSGDTDSFTLVLDAGQTLTLELTPIDGAVQGRIALVGLDGVSVLDTADSVNAGEMALLQTLAITTAGTYRIDASSIAGIGRYRVRTVLNALIAEDVNNAQQTAQSLDSSFISLGGTATRGAVRGTLDEGSSDWYSFTLNAGEAATLAVSHDQQGADVVLELYDSDNLLLAIGRDDAANVDRYLEDFMPATTGVYYVRISGSTVGAYSVVLTRGASLELNSNQLGHVQDITRTGQLLGVSTTADSSTSVFELPGNLYDASGYLWDIQGDGSINNGIYDAYNGGMIHSGFPSFSSVFAENNGREVVFEAGSDEGGIQITRKIYVPEGQSFARYLEIVTNNSAYTVNHTVPITTNLGSNGEEQFVRTSSGDESLSVDDDWVITDDSALGASSGTSDNPISDPVVTHVIAGQGGRIRPSSFTKESGNISYAYALTLAPGETQIIMHFASQAPDQDSALASAPQLASMELDALDGMSAAERRAVVNFNVVNFSAVSHDQYLIRANEGDALDIFTATPGDGSEEPVNVLDTKLVLYAPDGNQVAENSNGPDERNARIVYSVPDGASGIYRLELVSENGTQGDFVLSVTGATGNAAQALEVTNSSIQDGALFGSGYFPGSLQFTFSDSVLLSSLSGALLSVNGQTSSAFSVIDGQNVAFDLTDLIQGDGLYSVQLSGVADIHGNSLDAFNLNFYYDSQPPVVSALSIAPDAVLSSDALDFRATFSEDLDVAYLSPSSVVLTNTMTGQQIAANSLNYDGITRQIGVLFPELDEGTYQLSLINGGFRDFAGNTLNGDADFAVNFSVDAATRAYPTPLVNRQPAGSLIFDNTTTGLFNADGDTDSFTLALDAGQTLTLELTPIDDAVQGRITLVGLDGTTVLGTADGGAAGETVLLQTLAITTAGTYRIDASSIAGVGRYRVRTVLNALIAEDANNAQQTAQSLDSSFISLGGAATRGAVSGNLDGINSDWYSFTLNAGEAATLALTQDGHPDVTLELYGSDNLLLAIGRDDSTNVDRYLADFVPAATGIYYARISGSTVGAYSVVLTRGASLELNSKQLGHVQDITRTGQLLGVSTTVDSSTSVVNLPTNLHDASGFLWDIQGDGSISNGIYDAYDGGMIHSGFPIFSKASAEDNGREMVLEAGTNESGIQITRKIYVPEGQSFARYLEIVTNNSANTVNYTVPITTNLGSDGGERFVRTSSGDVNLSIADDWVITDDSAPGASSGAPANPISDPVVTHVIAGQGGRIRPSSFTKNSDNINYAYALTLAPGEAQIIMHFAGQASDQDSALARAPQLASMELNALEGMSAAERRAVVNFNVVNFGAGATDQYLVNVNEGDALDISTATPGDVSGEPVNFLDTKLALFAPDGTKVAENSNGPDGRNAVIGYSVPSGASGIYRVEVVSENNTQGAYVLSVTGATGSTAQALEVTNSSIQGGALFGLGHFPDSLQLTFSDSLLLSSVSAASLSVNGQTPSAFTVIDGKTIAFDLTSLNQADGLYSAQLSGLVDIHGNSLDAFNLNFNYDSQPPVVSAISIAPDAILSTEALDFRVTFNENLDATYLNSSNVVLINTLTGVQVAVSSFNYDNSTRQLRVLFPVLDEGTYQLSLINAGFRDLVGNRLGGGSDYAVNFTVDTTTRSFPTPLVDRQPAGSLIFDNTTTGLFNASGDTDSFTLALDAGQTLTLELTPIDGAVQGRVALVGPDGITVLGTADGSAVGQTVLLQTLAITTAGTYRIDASSIAGIGRYHVRAVINALVEVGSNNTQETAQSLAGSLKSLGGMATRGAVRGNLDGANSDWYSFTLNAGEVSTLALTDTLLPIAANLSLELYDSNNVLLAAGCGDAKNVDRYIADFVPTATGTYYARIGGPAAVGYSLLLTRGASFGLQVQNIQQDISAAHNVLGYSVGLVNTQRAAYLVSNNVGEPWGSQSNVNEMNVAFPTGWDRLKFETVNVGDLLANHSFIYLDGSDGNANELNAFLQANLVQFQDYVASGKSLFINAAPNEGGNINFGFGGVNLRYSDQGGTATIVDATHPIFQGPFTPVIATYSGNSFSHASVSGGGITRLLIDNSGGDAVLAELKWGEGTVLFGGMTTTNFHSPQPQANNLLGNILAYGATKVKTAVPYVFSAVEGDHLVIETHTPDDGLGGVYNALSLKLALYAPNGAVVPAEAFTYTTLADGRNVRINFTVPAGASGVYQVTVGSLNGTQGAYVLSVTGATASAAQPRVIRQSTADGQVVASPPAYLDLTFSEGLRLDTVQASDLVLDGGAVATSVQVIDGRSLRFIIDAQNTEVAYHYSLAAGAIQDLQGENSLAFSSSFVVDHGGPRVISQTPDQTTSAPFNQIDFTFSEAVSAASVTLADVSSFTGPGGINLLGQISSVTAVGNVVTVRFNSQMTLGQYALVIGPNIADMVGNAMDQNSNGIKGEGADSYRATITVRSPDLTVTAVNAVSSSVFGQTLDVSWTVKNIGTDPAQQSNWYDGIWLSRDNVLGGDDIRLSYVLTRLCSRSLWLSMASHGQGQPLSGFQTKG